MVTVEIRNVGLWIIIEHKIVKLCQMTMLIFKSLSIYLLTTDNLYDYSNTPKQIRHVD